MTSRSDLPLPSGPSYAGSAAFPPTTRRDPGSTVTLRVDLESGRSVYVTLPVGPGPLRGPIRLSTPDAGLLATLRGCQSHLKEALASGPRGLELLIQGLKPARRAS